MGQRERFSGVTAFALALFPVWVITIGLNWSLVAVGVGNSVAILSRGVVGAWTFVLRVVVFVILPYGQAHALGYDLASTFLGAPGPSPLFWPWILIAPICLLLVFRLLTGHLHYSDALAGYRDLLRPAAVFAALVWLGTLLTPGTDGLLLLVGPLSRAPGDVSALSDLAIAKSVVVLPYLVVWVCGVAPVFASLIPLAGRPKRRAEQAHPADGVR
jgi:hypothetical protein